MKLKELTEAIAQTCDVRANVVSAVQAETFRQVRAALDKGEKVAIPEFGLFLSKESTGEDGATKRVVKFKEKSDEKKEAKKEKRAAKKAAAGASGAANGGDGDDE